MTETHRTALLVFQSFARVLIQAIDLEIEGGSPSWREEASYQLVAAMLNLNPTDVPVADWREPLPQHIDSDRHRGPSDWDRECQESRRLNR